MTFYTIVGAAPYWYILNVKNFGFNYHSEASMVKILFFAPFFQFSGRIFAGALIIYTNFYIANYVTMCFNCASILLFTCFYDNYFLFGLAVYGLNFGLGSIMTCLFLCSVFLYENRLAIYMHCLFSLTQTLSVSLIVLTNYFVFNNFAINGTTAEFIQFFFVLYSRIDYLNP